MASASRLDELRRLYEDNQRRYFAPLANEYRKAGDLEQAIALCRLHLPDAPTTVSGHIVFGQALFETGQLDDARGAFEAAVALDPENLIALRQLGDIGRAQGDTDRARAWYQRVLDADPRNDDVQALIRDLPVGADASATPTPVSVPAIDSGSGESDDLGAPSELRELVELSLDDVPSGELARPDASLLDHAIAEEAVSLTVADPAAYGEINPDPAPSESPDAAVPTDRVSMELLLTADDAAAMEMMSPFDDPGPDDDVAGGFAVESASSDDAFGFQVDLGAATDLPVAESPPQVTDESPVDTDAMVPGGATREPDAMFATETMADVYLSQGLKADGIAILREVVEADPANASARGKLEALTQPAAPARALTARAFFAALAVRPAVAGMGRRHAAEAAHAAGRVSAPPSMGSIDALLGAGESAPSDESAAHALATAFNGPGDPPAEGRAARAATGELSLDTLFQGQPTDAGGQVQSWLSGMKDS